MQDGHRDERLRLQRPLRADPPDGAVGGGRARRADQGAPARAGAARRSSSRSGSRARCSGNSPAHLRPADHGLPRTAELQRAAQAIADRSTWSVTAEGTVGLDVPLLRPGGLVSIRGAGRLYNGSYFLTRVHHTIHCDGIEQTLPGGSATPSPRPAPSLRGDLHERERQESNHERSARALERDADRFYGKYRGIVTDNQDPLQIGRLKARVPGGARRRDERLGACPARRTPARHPASRRPARRRRRLDRVRGRRHVAADLVRRLVGDRRGADGREVDAARSRRARSCARSSACIVALDDAAQTITLSDALGVNLMTVKVAQGTIEIRSAVRVVLEAPLIQHGQGASHPAVFGDQLLTT